MCTQRILRPLPGGVLDYVRTSADQIGIRLKYATKTKWEKQSGEAVGEKTNLIDYSALYNTGTPTYMQSRSLLI